MVAKKSAKKSTHTPKAAAKKKAASKAAKIVKVKKELAKEVKVEKKQTTKQKVADTVKELVNPTGVHVVSASSDVDSPPSDADKVYVVDPNRIHKIDEGQGLEPLTLEPINSLDELISLAWDSVRGSDPPLASVAPDFVGTLHARAQSALKGSAMEGDSQLARFERAIQRLRLRFNQNA